MSNNKIVCLACYKGITCGGHGTYKANPQVVARVEAQRRRRALKLQQMKATVEAIHEKEGA